MANAGEKVSGTMNSVDSEKIELFQSRESAANWLKRALNLWTRTQRATSYAPFESAFRPNLSPHEILYTIYVTLGQQTDPEMDPQSTFRHGAAILIGEPELLNWNPIAAIELIRLGGKVASHEIIAAATNLMRGADLSRGLSFDQPQAASLAWEIYHAVISAGFTGPSLVDFLEACKRHTEAESIDPTHLLVMLAKHDRSNWANHLLSLAIPLHLYYLRRLPDDGEDGPLQFFIEDLTTALDEYSSDYGKIFVDGWLIVANSKYSNKLHFLFGSSVIEDMLGRHNALDEPINRLAAQRRSGDLARPNSYVAYLSRRTNELAGG
jgi:hypothetical protein